MIQPPCTFRVKPKIHSFNKHLCKLGTENTNILNDKFMKVHIYCFSYSHKHFRVVFLQKQNTAPKIFSYSYLREFCVYYILHLTPSPKINPLPIKPYLTTIFPLFKSLIAQTTQLEVFPHLIYSGRTSHSIPVFF